MPKLVAVTALAMGAVFLMAQAAPASAQVMKNFSWKKKSAKAKPHDASTTKPAEMGTGRAPATKRQRGERGN